MSPEPVARDKRLLSRPVMGDKLMLAKHVRSLARRVLIGGGLLAIVVGLTDTAIVARDIINESQGKCDYLPCVWPWTYPLLSAFVALAVAGGVLVATALARRRT